MFGYITYISVNCTVLNYIILYDVILSEIILYYIM